MDRVKLFFFLSVHMFLAPVKCRVEEYAWFSPTQAVFHNGGCFHLLGIALAFVRPTVWAGEMGIKGNSDALSLMGS